MVATKQPSTFLFLLVLVTLSSIIISSTADDCVGNGTIAVYWGQGDMEGEDTLEKTCATGLYDIVLLQSIIANIPILTFIPYCDNSTSCTQLQSQIEYCQKNNIKVFLSLVLYTGDHFKSAASSTSEDDYPKQLADYLLKNYLSGQPGPLGNVSLDGIDIYFSDASGVRWERLVKAINASTTERRIYISACPQCGYPDKYQGDAIKTGLVDFIWIDFSNSKSCQYSNGDATNVLNAWKNWTSIVPNRPIFLGVMPTDEINYYNYSYISPDALKSEVLPTVKEASNYGGVMIMNRYYDFLHNYTAQIQDSVFKICESVHDEPAFSSF